MVLIGKLYISSMFDDLRKQILGQGSEQSALAKHLVFHEMYRSGGILDAIPEDDSDLSDRERYIRSGLTSLSMESDENFADRVRDSIVERSIYADIDSDRSIGRDGGSRLKSLMRGVSSQLKGAIGENTSEVAIDDFIGTSLYKSLFESPKPADGGYHYQSFRSEDSLRSRLFGELVSTDDLHGDIDFYLNNEGIDPADRRSRDSFGYSLNRDKSEYNIGSSLDRRVFKTRYELARLRGKTYKQYSNDDAMDYLHSLVDQGGYINKPGIAPFVSLIETSDKFLDLDMFQFQNDALTDLYFNKILENSKSLADGDFKVRIRVAGSDEGSKGETGFSILGPNKIQLERFSLLRDTLIDKLFEKYLGEENDPDLAFDKAKSEVYRSFQLVETDRKNHRKLAINENLAVLGSTNWTQPLGKSIYQEGSTYEAARFFRRYEWVENFVKSGWGGQFQLEANLRTNKPISAKERADIENRMNEEVISTKLYKQMERVNNLIQSQPNTRLMTSGESNIALSHDIWNHMGETLEYANRDRGTTLKLMLDQPFLLQFGTDPYLGEMGRDDSLSDIARQRKYRESIQDKLYTLIKDDRAQVVLDVRNYRDKVIDPLYKVVENILGTEDFNRRGRNLERLVDLGKSFDDRERELRTLFGSKSYTFTDEDEFSNVDQVIKQLLVATSGNITLSTQAKQHLKSYGLFNADDNLISYYMGSSNLGPGSLAVDLRDMAANEELGLILSTDSDRHKANKGRSQWDLNADEEKSDLLAATRNFHNQWGTLTGQREKGKRVDRRASWEKDVDTKGVERLADNFRQINEALGFEAIQVNYLMGGITGSKRIGINVDINSSAITGLSSAPRVNYKFTALQYAPGDDRGGYVLAINQSKAIGRSLFVNNREKDGISMPFGIGGGSISAGTSVTLDAIENTSIRVATMVGELAYKSMVAGPTAYLTSLYGNDAIAATFIGYLEHMVTGVDQGGSWLANASRSDLEQVSHLLRTKLYSSDGSRARQIAGMDSSQVDKERRQHLEDITGYIEDMKRTYDNADPSQGQDDRMNILANVVNAWRRQNIAIWQDLALDIVAANNDFAYEGFISQQINATSKYILEDTVTQGKQSSYGGPQGYMKVGLLGVNDSPQYRLLNERSAARHKGIGNIFNFARFTPLSYGPTDETHLAGAFRSVADGGGSRASNDHWSGITMFGLAKQEVGNIADVDVVNYIGAGFTTSVGDLENYLRTITNDGDTAARLARSSLRPGASSDTNIVTYMLNPGKVSQIAQRMKNFMGSQPLHVINEEVARIMDEESVINKDGVSISGTLSIADEGVIPLSSKIAESNRRAEINKVKKSLHELSNSILPTLTRRKSERPFIENLNRNIDTALKPLYDYVDSDLDTKRSTDISVLIDRIETDLANIFATSYSSIRSTSSNSNFNRLPIHTMMEQVNAAFNTILSDESLEFRPKTISDSRESLSGYLNDQMTSLRSRVASVLKTTGNIADDKLADKKAASLIDDSYSYSFIMSGGIRKSMGGGAIQVLELERQAVLDELGLDEGYINDPNHKALVDQLLRARLVRRDVISPGIKGFIGPVDRKPQITYIQLGGAYSDYFQANPVYGGAKGQREGFIDRQEKRLKASMLSNNWTGDNSKVIAREGDYISYDSERQRVVIVSGINGSGSTQAIPIEAFSRNEVARLKGMVDSMGMRDVFANVADNQFGVSGESSFATYKAATWYSAGEDSIEYTLSSKWLTADPEANQGVFEIMLLRSKRPGGGSRYDASGSLFKGVAHFLHQDTMQSILDRISKSYDKDGPNHAHDWKGADSRVDIHNVLGLGGPSHIKSYSFEHGAALLENRELMERTLNNSDSHLAMSLLLGFGTGFIQDAGSNIDNLKKIKRLMYEKAMDGTLSSYYKDLAVKSMLSATFSKDLRKAAGDYLKSHRSLGSVDDVLNDPAIYKKLVAEVVSSSLMGKASYSVESTPYLIGIQSSELIEALQGNPSTLGDKIRTVLGEASDTLNRRGTLDFTDPGERSAINVMAAIDLNMQLASQREVQNMPSDVDLTDRVVLKQMASILGSYDLVRIDHDDNYAQEVIENIRPQLTSYKVIALRTANMFSESKVAIGKKYEANLELQYMMKGFTGAFKSLKAGGKLSQIKKAVATIYKATSVYDEMMVSDIESAMPDIDIKMFHDLEFTSYGSKKSLGKSKFLGVYGGSSNLSTLGNYRKAMLDIVTKNQEEVKRLMRDLSIAITDRNLLEKDNTIENREQKLSNNAIALSKIYRQLVMLNINTNEDFGSSTVENQLRAMARELESDASKGFGVGQAKNFLDAMETSGQRSFMFALPSITSVSKLDGSSNVRVAFDYDNPTYVFMPDAQMLKNLGVEFGSYIADELKYTMLLSTGFAPGTTMSLIRDQLALNFTQGREYVDINRDDLSKVQEYWKAASQMTHLLTMSASGTISKRAFANENRMPGLVSTAVGSFQVPNNMAVIARAGLERHGLKLNPKRETTIQNLNALVHDLSNEEQKYNAERQAKLIERYLRNPNNKAENFRYRYKESMEKAAIRQQALGLTRGASPEAVAMLKKVRETTQHFERELAQLEGVRTGDRTTYRDGLSRLKESLKDLRRVTKAHAFNEDGDKLLLKVAETEQSYWVQRLSMLELNSKDSRTDAEEKRIATYESNIGKLERSPWAIDELAIGSKHRSKRQVHRLAIEDLENSTRGRAGVASFDEDHWKSLTSGDMFMSDIEQKNLFLHMLDNKILAFQSIQSDITGQYTFPPSAPGEDLKMNESVIDDLRVFINNLGNIRDDLNKGTILLSDAKGRLNRSLSTRETTSLSQVFMTRSAPTGGMEHQRQMLGIIRNLADINRKADASQSSAQLFRSDVGDTSVGRLSRNDTLTLINPLSQITMALGDFDGDPYTAIFAGMADMSNSAQKIRDKLYALDIKLSHLSRELTTVRSDLSYYEHEFELSLKHWAPKKSESDLLKKEQELTEKISRLESTKSESNKKLGSLQLKISAARDMLDSNVYNKALRRDTVNYMGLNYSLFEADTRLDTDSALFDMDVNILPTLIEQGSGLFSGFEGKGKGLASVRTMLDSIVKVNPSVDLQGQVQIRKDRKAIEEAISALASENPQNHNYQALMMINEAREELISQIHTQFGTENEVIEANEYTRRLSELTNSVHQTLSGLRETQGKLGQATGITIDYSTYDFITKVLGKAGGDLLGKTYNTLIGTLYSDTPLIAMAHVMGLDMDESGQTRGLIQQGIRESLGGDADILFDTMRTNYDEASATQGFMKNIHQLLRDSIKFKSDSGDLKARLMNKASEYDKASADDKERIIAEMTASLGPGPGLSAIINLNTLILEKDSIAGIGAFDDDRAKEYLSSTFGMSSFGSVDSDGNLVPTNMRGFETVAEEYMAISGKTKENVSLLDVANYKVAEDLKTLVTAYRYEKYVESGKADVIMGSGYSLEKRAINSINREGGGVYEWLSNDLGIITNNGADVDANALLTSLNSEYGGRSLRSILDSQIDKDLNDWYRNLPANKRRRVTEVSGLSFTSDELSRADKGVIRRIIEEEDTQANKFMGHHGEGLDRFTTLSQVRMGLAGVMSGDLDTVSSRFAEADVATTLLNLATQDKLTAGAQAVFFNTMVSTMGMSEPAPLKENFNDDELYKVAKREYESDLKINILRRLSGAEGDGSSSMFLGISDEQRDRFSTAFDKFLDNSLTINGITYDKGIDFISYQIEETAVGQRQSMVQAIVEADQRTLKKRGQSGTSTALSLAKSIIDDPSDLDSMYSLMYKLGELGLDGDHPAKALRKMQQDRQQKYAHLLEKDYRIVERETAKAQRNSNVLDFIAPIALTLLGGAVASGGITEDHIGQLVGASFTTLAYGKSGFAKRAAYSFTGSAFRLKNAIEQHGSEEKAILSYVAQEGAFMLGSMVLAPAIDNVVNSVVSRGIDPKVKYKDAVAHDLNPLAYKLKSGAVLDVDRFASSKAISGSVTTALLGAVLGMTSAAVVGEMIAAPRRIKTDSAIDLAIEGLTSNIRRAEGMRVDMESSMDDISVEDDSGAEYVNAEREVSAMESIYASAIDPMEDFSYIHFDAPPFAMVGVSITSEEYS